METAYQKFLKKSDKRNKEIVKERLEPGSTLKKIAEKHGITVQRVRSILEREKSSKGQ